MKHCHTVLVVLTVVSLIFPEFCARPERRSGQRTIHHGGHYRALHSKQRAIGYPFPWLKSLHIPVNEAVHTTGSGNLAHATRLAPASGVTIDTAAFWAKVPRKDQTWLKSQPARRFVKYVYNRVSERRDHGSQFR